MCVSFCEFSDRDWTKGSMCCTFKRDGFVDEADVQMEGTVPLSVWAPQVNLAKLIFFPGERAAQLENWAEHKGLFSENRISSLSQALSLGQKLPQNEKQEGSFSHRKGDSRAVRECWAKRQCN